MKNILKNTFAILAITAFFVSCTSDDNVVNDISGTGNLDVEFDNAFADNDLMLNIQSNTTSYDEVLKIGKVKYVISNIVLTNENGTTFTYPKNESYFIVDESDETSLVLDLENIPAGNYTKIKFGIGVDQAQYDLGESNQGGFLAQAQNQGMMTSWTEGYIFISFDGTFTAPTVTTPTDFMVQLCKANSSYNYTEVTLNLPTKALVRTTITPELHIVADVSKIIDGTNKVKLSDNTMDGMAMIMDGANMAAISANLLSMFTVAHVHND